MAVVQELIAKLGFQVDQAGMQKADNSLKGLVSGALAVAAAYKAAGLVMDSVKRAANLESLNAEFEVMLGNAEAARYLVQQINQFAAETPFETEGLVSNVRLMMAFGQSANQAMSAVKMLGDVAGADQERLSRLSLAYAQVMSAGKLQGQDLLQFVNAGFNPLQELTQITGKSMGTLRKEMEKGRISADMMVQAFDHATSKGGRFFGNMEKQSQTLTGLWSTLKDSFKMLSAELGGNLVPFLKDVIRALIPMADAIGGAYRQLSEFFSTFLGDGMSAVTVAGLIAMAFGTVADVIMVVLTALQGVWTVLEGIGTFLGMVMGAVMDFVMLLPKAFAYVAKGIASMLIGVGRLTGNRELVAYGAQQRAELEGFIGGGLLSNTYTQAQIGIDRTIASGKKTADLASMIGGSQAAAAGSEVSMTDSILKALQGNGKTVTNNVNVETNIYADGSLKDILTEQANSIIGLGLQTRLQAAMV